MNGVTTEAVWSVTIHQITQLRKKRAEGQMII